MRSVMFSTLPNFMEQIPTTAFRSAVQIINQATSFPASGSHERPQFRLQQRILPILGAQNHDQRHAILRQFVIFDPRTLAGLRLARARPFPG